MANDLTAKDLWPLVQRLPRAERIRLAKLALSARATSDADAYSAAQPTPGEFDSDDDPLSWEADGWDGVDAPR
jgi:hypothetical protein